jgi:hypothetical protein
MAEATQDPKTVHAATDLGKNRNAGRERVAKLQELDTLQ